MRIPARLTSVLLFARTPEYHVIRRPRYKMRHYPAGILGLFRSVKHHGEPQCPSDFPRKILTRYVFVIHSHGYAHLVSVFVYHRLFAQYADSRKTFGHFLFTGCIKTYAYAPLTAEFFKYLCHSSQLLRNKHLAAVGIQRHSIVLLIAVYL